MRYASSDRINYIDSTRIAKWRVARRIGQSILQYSRRIARREALFLRKIGNDVVMKSSRAARKLENDISRELGGNGKAVCESPHGPKQSPHAHAQHGGPRDRFPGHTFVDPKLPSVMPMGPTGKDGSPAEHSLLDLLAGPIMLFPSSGPPDA
ncbi:hypothetical protein WME79_45515 [Sorangium sp. So ce726]|uniref:hypothetical protein n=1 Tax=Sorangium sp. So ce726 TaxID=3133319 RepID=UPI003F6014C6